MDASDEVRQYLQVLATRRRLSGRLTPDNIAIGIRLRLWARSSRSGIVVAISADGFEIAWDGDQPPPRHYVSWDSPLLSSVEEVRE